MRDWQASPARGMRFAGREPKGGFTPASFALTHAMRLGARTRLGGGPASQGPDGQTGRAESNRGSGQAGRRVGMETDPVFGQIPLTFASRFC